MRDFLPERMILRNWVAHQLRTAFESFGFEPLDTPAVEYADTLKGKYGEEADKLIYAFQDRGGREVGLRYDLTVPFARVVASNPELPRPFKRYQLAPVWRAERPQKGRYREFWQCDVDIAGTTSPLADAECLMVVAAAFERLAFKRYTIKINDRRLLTALAASLGVDGEAALGLFRSLDKLDKIGEAGVRDELATRGIAAPIADELFHFMALGGDLGRMESYFATRGTNATAAAGIAALRTIDEALQASGVGRDSYAFDPSMVRGLDYYTGPIFETSVEEPRIGSLSGGGRYDTLIGMLSGRDVPATGVALGFERILDVIEELGLQPGGLTRTVTEVLVTIFSQETLGESLALARDFRASGLRAELALTGDRLPNQLRYASRRGIPLVAIVGPDELVAGEVVLRDMASGEQTRLPRASAADELVRRRPGQT